MAKFKFVAMRNMPRGTKVRASRPAAAAGGSR